MHHASAPVAKDLHLHVTLARKIFLENELAVAEGGARLVAGGVERARQLGRLGHDPHAAPAAARGRLDEERKAQPYRFLREAVRLLRLAVIARHGRDASGLHDGLGLRLVADGADGGRAWVDEDDPGLGAGLREIGVLREKAVARMNGLRAALARGIQDARDRKIAVARRAGPDQVRLVRHGDMHGLRIGRGINRDGANAETARGADDPARDLAAIGDQDRVEHRGIRYRTLSWPGLSRPSRSCWHDRAFLSR